MMSMSIGIFSIALLLSGIRNRVVDNHFDDQNEAFEITALAVSISNAPFNSSVVLKRAAVESPHSLCFLLFLSVLHVFGVQLFVGPDNADGHDELTESPEAAATIVTTIWPIFDAPPTASQRKRMALNAAIPGITIPVKSRENSCTALQVHRLSKKQGGVAYVISVDLVRVAFLAAAVTLAVLASKHKKFGIWRRMLLNTAHVFMRTKAHTKKVDSRRGFLRRFRERALGLAGKNRRLLLNLPVAPGPAKAQASATLQLLVPNDLRTSETKRRTRSWTNIQRKVHQRQPCHREIGGREVGGRDLLGRGVRGSVSEPAMSATSRQEHEPLDHEDS